MSAGEFALMLLVALVAAVLLRLLIAAWVLRPVESRYRLTCDECEWGCTVTSKNLPARLMEGGVDRLLFSHTGRTGHRATAKRVQA